MDDNNSMGNNELLVGLNTHIPESLYMDFKVVCIRKKIKSVKEGVRLALSFYIDDYKKNNVKE